MTRLIQDIGVRLGRGIAEELEGGHDALPENPDAGEHDTGNASRDDLDMSWIAELASIRKWSRVVSDATSGLGLDMGSDPDAEQQSTI